MYKTIILPVVLYGCEFCSLRLREEHELRVSEKMVLRRILESKKAGLNNNRRLEIIAY
jgi:radical SAM superfamily enzyme YgiQ (UPF0313 family)